MSYVRQGFISCLVIQRLPVHGIEALRGDVELTVVYDGTENACADWILKQPKDTQKTYIMYRIL